MRLKQRTAQKLHIIKSCRKHISISPAREFSASRYKRADRETDGAFVSKLTQSATVKQSGSENLNSDKENLNDLQRELYQIHGGQRRAEIR